MSFKLIARIEPYGAADFLASIESIKGMAESGSTPEEAVKELLISLKVKMAHDLGVELNELSETIIKPLEEYTIERKCLEEVGYAEKEISLSMAI